MTDPDDLVREFHRTYDVPIRTGPPTLNIDRLGMRLRLIAEEYEDELLPAIEAGDLVEVADALGDIVYVIYGMALECGIPRGHAS